MTAPATRAVPELSGGTHFPCLDAYRGIGMIMVLLAHASFATGHVGAVFGPYVSRLEIAVPMFFILSGFLLFRPYALALLGVRPSVPPRLFLRRRALRIFPAYVFGLFAIVLLFGKGVLQSAWDWIANILLLQQFGSTVPLRITQAWSIGVELTFYLLLPLVVAALFAVVRRTERPFSAMLGTVGLLYAVGWAFRLFVVATAPNPTPPTAWQAHALNWLPMYLDFFAIGMALGIASAAVQHGTAVPRLLGVLAGHPALSWCAMAVIVVLVAQMHPPATPFGLNGAEYLPRQFAYEVAAFIWLVPAMFGDQRVGRFRAFLASHPLQYLGALSLSFYIWHLAILGQVQRRTVPHYDQLHGIAVFTGNFWLVSGLTFVITLAIAAVCHRFVETPFLRLKDRPLREVVRLS